jgi:hypothetical protein
MHMLYNSESFAVVQFVVADEPAAGAPPGLARGSYEIVDKFARKELYLDGALAEHFKQGVEALIETEPDTEAMDAFLAGYTLFAQQPLTLH